MTLVELYTMLQENLLDVFVEYINAKEKALN